MKFKEILVVSFGTSYNESCQKAIGAIENEISKAFPEYIVRRAFTSSIIIDILNKNYNILVDNVEKALERAVSDGIKEIVVQPTHIINGREYNKISDILKKYAKNFDKMTIGKPLLSCENDFKRVMSALIKDSSVYDNEDTAICFMGHGTDVEANNIYCKLQRIFNLAGFKNYFIGTVEAYPSIHDIVKLVQNGQYKNVVLKPLMVVSGEHVNNDMAGDNEDSWKTVFKKAGYNTDCILTGIGELFEIQKIYVEHTKEAIKEIM